VTTSANGELNFYKYHKGTRKHIQKIMLPLQELWANPPERRQRGKVNFQETAKKQMFRSIIRFCFLRQSIKSQPFCMKGIFYFKQ
jgi:hypothetical protein